MSASPGLPRVLVVDDELDLHELLLFNLRQGGFEPTAVATGAEALRELGTADYAVLVLDLMLPDVPGTELCRTLRATPRWADLPVLLLTARADEHDRLDGFMAGADDYVVKPFSVKELVLRVKALARRAAETRAARAARSGRKLAWRGMVIDTSRHEVEIDGVPLALRALEYKLIATLLEQPERMFSRAELLAEVWGVSPLSNTRTVDTHVRRLRERLGDYGVAVETVHRFGYRLRTP